MQGGPQYLITVFREDAGCEAATVTPAAVLSADRWSVVPGEGLSYFRDDDAAPVLLHDAVTLVS